MILRSSKAYVRTLLKQTKAAGNIPGTFFPGDCGFLQLISWHHIAIIPEVRSAVWLQRFSKGFHAWWQHSVYSAWQIVEHVT